MKKINIIVFGILLVSLFILPSCKKWIDTDLNVDPNRPAEVTMDLLLPGIQCNMSYGLLGNDAVRTTNMWMQQFNGFARQSLTQGRYSYRSADVGNLWAGIYAGDLNDLKIMLDLAESSNSPHYVGVTKVLTAWNLVTTSDLWGDIPYSESCMGVENLTPAYDTGQTIYAVSQTLLDEAITALAATESTHSPGADDMMFGGNLDQWTSVAYALKARFALNLSKVNGNSAYSEALTHLANGLTSNADNMTFTFDATNQGPIFQFMEQRGDISMGATFVDILIADGDPRIAEYCADADEDVAGDQYVGGRIGHNDEEMSPPGDFVAAGAATGYFMTYYEQKFIEAEANLELGQAAAAYTAYLVGCVASVMEVTGLTQAEVEALPWYTAIDVGQANLDLPTIMRQKYISAFGTVQVYTDWRRTDLPALSLANGAVTTEIPRRYPYPQTELDYNGDNVTQVQITDRLWWDTL